MSREVDTAWMRSFIRIFREAPSQEELEARRLAILERDEKARAHFAQLSADEQARQEGEVRDYIARLIPDLADYIVEEAERIGSEMDRMAEKETQTQLSFRELLLKSQPEFSHNLIMKERKGANYTLAEISVYPQRKHFSCGYHSLHNAVLFMDALSDENPSAHHVHRFHSSYLFWKRYWYLHDLLQEQVRALGVGYYPWSEKSVRAGIMERDYMTHAIGELQKRRLLPPAVEIIPLPEALSKLTGSCTYEEVVALRDAFQRLSDGSSSSAALCIGLVNHWVALLVNRVGDQWEFFLCDSICDGQVPIVDATDDEIWQRVQDWVDYRLRNGKVSQAHEQLLYNQGMIDTRTVVNIIVERLTEASDVVADWFAHGISKVLDSFETSLPPAGEEGKESLYNPGRISAWLSNSYHPRLIEETLHDRLAAGHGTLESLSPELKQRLVNWYKALWIQMQSEEYRTAVEMQAPFLERFTETIKGMASFLEADEKLVPQVMDG